jgi:hypothetical protein
MWMSNSVQTIIIWLDSIPSFFYLLTQAQEQIILQVLKILSDLEHGATYKKSYRLK